MALGLLNSIASSSGVGGAGAMPNLVVNGGFDTDLSGWLNQGGNPAASWDPVSGGVLRIQTAFTFNGLHQVVAGLDAGKTYHWAFDFNRVQGEVLVNIGPVVAVQDDLATGFQQRDGFITGETSLDIILRQGNANGGFPPADLYFDNISLREVP